MRTYSAERSVPQAVAMPSPSPSSSSIAIDARAEDVERPNADARPPVVDARTGPSRRGDDAPPVRVGAVDRCLHQVRRGDRSRGLLRVVIRDRSGDANLEHLRHALAVGDDHARELVADLADE